jgi:hypothetical protein
MGILKRNLKQNEVQVVKGRAIKWVSSNVT